MPSQKDPQGSSKTTENTEVKTRKYFDKIGNINCEKC